MDGRGRMMEDLENKERLTGEPIKRSLEEDGGCNWLSQREGEDVNLFVQWPGEEELPGDPWKSLPFWYCIWTGFIWEVMK